MDLKIELSKEYFLKNRIVIIGVALALIGVFYAYRIYTEKAVAFNGIRSEISVEGNNADIARRLSAVQVTLDGYRNCFARGKDTLWLLDKVSKAAGDSGLTISSLNSKPLVFFHLFVRAETDMVVSGTYHQFGDFISRLESSSEYIKISRLSLKREGDALRAELGIETYFWK